MQLRPVLTLVSLVLLGCAKTADDLGTPSLQGGGGGNGGATTTGGSGTGAGSSSGGSGNAATGGSATGGSSTGGRATGGASTGGSATGGAATGGAATGGAATGGAATGGAATGGSGTGGTATGSWKNVTGNLANMASECGNLNPISAKPDMDMLITGVAQHGLWSSTDGGTTWTALGTGAGSATITNRAIMIVYDPAHVSTWWEAGIYNGGGVYKTTDNGVTFKQLGTIGHNDSVSVDFSDPNRMTLLAGGHEAQQKLWKSTDGGATWTDIGPSLPAGSSFSSNTFIADAQNFSVGCAGYAGNLGIFRTTNGGTSWTSTSAAGATPAPLVATDGTVYWPVIYNRGLLRSTDKGATWANANGNWNTLLTISIIQLPDGRLASSSGDGNGAAPYIVISSDKGATWKQFGPRIPFTPNSITYSSFRKAFYASHFSCSNSVPSNGIMELDFDYTQN